MCIPRDLSESGCISPACWWLYWCRELPAGRARGRAVGRPKALTPDQVQQLRALHAADEEVPVLVTTFVVSEATVYRLLAEEQATV